MVGRQAGQMLAALVIARVLGPETYGAISAATVYVTLTTLMLDQGLAPALVQRPRLTRGLAGAVATANLLAAAVLAGLTWILAPLIADFFAVPALTGLLRVLGFGLLLKALAITPRALQQRRLGFKNLAVADVTGGVLGAATGITAALLGAGIWSMAWQVLVTDAVIGLLLLVLTRGPRPTLRLRVMGIILPFSLRIFGSNSLAFLSRNSDNVLVGRFLGVEALSHYSMAYRVLVIPVQMIGQTVNRVSFPTFSRLSGDPDGLRRSVSRTMGLLAFAAIPTMCLVAVAAPQLVSLVLGPEWAPTAPVLMILAVAGARETVFNVTQSLMRACGAGRIILRYEILATTTQVAGILVGLQFGLVGVALGLTIAGFLLTPVLMIIQRRLSGIAVRSQLRTVAPAVHCSVWGAAAYSALTFTPIPDIVLLLLGSVAYLVVAGAVLLIVHRAASTTAMVAGLQILGLRKAAKV